MRLLTTLATLLALTASGQAAESLLICYVGGPGGTKAAQPNLDKFLRHIEAVSGLEATTIPKERLCRACFDGVYPVQIPEPHGIGKHVLEGIERRVAAETLVDIEGVAATVGTGAQDALGRP